MAMQPTGYPSCGSLCNQTEQSTSSLCFTSSGPGSSRSRRSIDSLGGVRRLCVPPHCSDSTGVTTLPVVPVQTDFDRALLAQQGLVPAATRAGRSKPHSVTSHKRSTRSSTHQTVSLEPGNSESARVDSVSKNLKNQGFSQY